jgi:hypothetical protein
VRHRRSAAPALLAAALLVSSGAARVHAQSTPSPAGATRESTSRAPRLTLTLDAGAASVAWDEYLRSSAATLTPAGRLDWARGSLTARGAVSQFQGGNRSWQGALAGTVLVPLRQGVVAELGASGSSTYYDGAVEGPAGSDRAGSLLGEARVHASRPRAGMWLGVTAGAATDGFDRTGLWQGELAGWGQVADLTMRGAVRPTQVGALSFVDAEGALRWWWRTRLELAATLGARGGSTGGGARVWQELVASWWLAPRLAVVAGAGRFPTDLLNGVPGARYAALSVRVASRPLARLEAAARPARAALPGAAPLALLRALPAGDMVVRITATGETLVRLRAPEATTVEIMGDFTDWEPVALVRSPDGMWERAFALTPGTYRFNVRRDGGAWEVPTGVTALPDDLGGEAGLLVVG